MGLIPGTKAPSLFLGDKDGSVRFQAVPLQIRGPIQLEWFTVPEPVLRLRRLLHPRISSQGASFGARLIGGKHGPFIVLVCNGTG